MGYGHCMILEGKTRETEYRDVVAGLRDREREEYKGHKAVVDQ